MRKVLIFAFAGAVAACASAPPKECEDESGPTTSSGVTQRAGVVGTTSLVHPIIHAELLSVAAGTIVELVGGTAYLTRNSEAIQIQNSVGLESEDLLQIHSGSIVRLRSPDGQAIELRHEHGEWFQFVVRGN